MTEHPDKPLVIAAIGDVHNQWEAEDRTALHHLGVDLALFVGDFGNEAVEVVADIAALDLPFAAITGNHDAWYTATAWGRKRAPYDPRREDRVQQQLDLLGAADVGYGKRDFPEWGLSVVGGRPFSWGGPEWRNGKFYRDRYGINNFEESAARIIAAAKQTACDTLIFLGHNGPLGLGDRPEDPCGKDWEPLGGDFGDRDLTTAIAQVRDWGKTIPLVVFGHMHHSLRHTQTQQRQAVFVSPEGTIYLNAAAVPRIIDSGGRRLRNFCRISVQGETVETIDLVWVDGRGAIASRQSFYPSASTKKEISSPSFPA